MKEMADKRPDIDWPLAFSILFWITTIAGFVILVSMGRTTIPRPVLEIEHAPASRGNLIIAHRDGDPVWMANTRCRWTPDISAPQRFEEAGSLVLTGKERNQGRVSKLEPGETARLEKDIHMKAGTVGRLLIADQKSGFEIFSRTIAVER